MKKAMKRASQIETRLEDRKDKELTTLNSVSSTPRYKNPVQDRRDIPLKSALKFGCAQTKVDIKEILINQDRDISKVKCYGCGELGHYQNRCSASCTKCSKIGHSAEFCRSGSIYLKCTEYKVIQDTINSVGKGASFIRAQVKNKSFSALIDSGAAVSMISRHFADETGTPWTAIVHSTAYYSAGMNPLQVVGEVQMRVELGDTFFNEKFLVTNNLSQKMIIGGDVLRKNKIYILFSNREIRLNGTVIPMIALGSETIESVTEEFRPSDLVCIRIA